MTLYEETTRYLLSASEIYDQIEFNSDALFNEPAPEPWVAFLIGSLFSACSFVMWSLRVWTLKVEMEDEHIPFRGSSMIRALVSATIDSSSSPYVIVSYSAASFILLGAFQINYEKTMIVMVILYFITSAAEIVRIILTFKGTDSLDNIRLSCDILRAQFRDMNQNELNPKNLYEDLGRGMSTVLMTFSTQCLFISFVFVDVYETPTTSCRDGTSGCPKVGTFGSWGFYVIGIYMAIVYLLGPKTNYGHSEQNPAYWIQLLILARDSPTITWYDPIKHKHHERRLYVTDPQIWVRFFMTFLINGVGFHILVHALPIQVAATSSFTGVVFRAVGMMYLVDLDDTTGYTLTVREDPTTTKKILTTSRSASSALLDKSKKAEISDGELDNLYELSDEAQRIIDEVRAKLEVLAMRQAGVKLPKTVFVPSVEASDRVKEDPKPAATTDSDTDEEHPRQQSKSNVGAKAKDVVDTSDEKGIEVRSMSMAEF